jgi:hypothetical protein
MLVTSSPPTTATATTAMMTSSYDNPTGNTYFCGHTYADIAVRCLESKPCPTGAAAGKSGSISCFFCVIRP